MAKSAPVVRQTYFPKLSTTIPFDIRHHLQLIYQKLGNHTDAFAELTSRISGTSAKGTQTSGGVSGVISPNNFPAQPHIFLTGYKNGAFFAAQPSAHDLIEGTTGTGPVVEANSPTLTGVPLSPTAAQDTATTQLATTGFVIGQASAVTPLVDAGAGAVGASLRYARADHVHPNGPLVPKFAFRSVVANYTIDPTADYQIECKAGSLTITLPSAVGIAGQVFSIKDQAAGSVSVVTTGGQTIDGSPSQNVTANSNLMVMSDGANYIVI